MATFEYYGLPGVQQQAQPVQYAQPQQQQQQGGMNPMQGLGIYNQFAGDGGLFGGGAAGGGTGGAAAGGTAGGGAAGTGAAAGGGAAGSAGGSGASALSSAGPWAALAAVIIGNEREGIRQGHRDEDEEKYAQHVLSGKVVEQDMNKRWIPKIFGDDDYGIGGDIGAATELGSLDFSNAWDKFKNDSSVSKILDIF